jgi:hypothetical protein
MRNLIFMPESYKDLSREELINAFLSNYYEIIIALDDKTELENIKDNLYIAIKQTDGDNAFLWKHIWLAYFAYTMHRASFGYFCDVVRKERMLLKETSDDEFLRLLTTLNVSTKILSHGYAVIGSPRLVEELVMDGHVYARCEDIFEKREKIIELAPTGKESFKFKSDFIEHSKYFNFNEFIFDSLLMLRHNFKVTQDSIANCLESVVKVIDNEQFMNYCKALSDAIEFD